MFTSMFTRANPFPGARRNARKAIGLLLALCFWLGIAGISRGEPNTPEGLTLPTSPQAVAIATGGHARLAVTLAPQASESTRTLATELAGYLQRMTGAEFAIEQGTHAQGITLGTLEQFPDESLNESLAIRDGYDGREAYAIRSDGQGIRLLGKTELGVSHAAYRFLELLGCRWFFQGPTWEVVPTSPDLAFNLNETGRPDILSRSIWFGRTTQAWEKGDPDANAAFARWRRGNRMGDSIKVNIHHQWHAIPKDFPEEFAAHPEYFALVDGKRTPPQFCVSNAGLQQVIVQYANRFFEKNPEFDMVSLDPADQGGWCTCPECAKLGPYSDQAFHLANVVAKALQQSHPGKFVGLLAYSWHSDAPDFQLEPNVYVQLTAGMNASKYTFDELFQAWSEKCRHVGIYEYYSYWQMDKCMLPGTRVCNDWDQLGERMKRFVDHRVNSISGQSANNWGVNGLGYYLAAKLMWNASADVQALKKDFFAQAFGPAAEVLQRYYERSNPANKPHPGAALLRQCLADLEEATPLAAGRPEVLQRLNALKENLVYSYLGWKVETAADAAKKASTLEWFTWSYRTRNNYMNDWITFRSAVGHPAAEELGEPTWFWRNTMKNPQANPWRKDEPVTAEELATRFQEMKADLGEVPTTSEPAYAGQRVLVKAPGASGTERKQLFTGTAVYLLASLKGEPLRFSVTKRATGPWEKPDAKYALVSQEGQELAAGGLPTGQHDLELKVPGPGVYRFTCRRGGQGWEVAFPPTLPHALVFERETDCRPTYMPAAYFYVPKGTPEIVMYAAVNSSVAVRAPDNRLAHTGSSEGRYVVMRVEAGEDGKVWSIQGKFRNLWLFNIPTILSSSPEWLFVPEDLAKRDGLEVVLP